MCTSGTGLQPDGSAATSFSLPLDLPLGAAEEAVLSRIEREWHLPGKGPLETLRVHVTRALDCAAEMVGEPNVQALIRRRITEGRAEHGPLDLAALRAFLVEALHELCDCRFYVGCEEERRARAAARPGEAA